MDGPRSEYQIKFRKKHVWNNGFEKFHTKNAKNSIISQHRLEVETILRHVDIKFNKVVHAHVCKCWESNDKRKLQIAQRYFGILPTKWMLNHNWLKLSQNAILTEAQ